MADVFLSVARGQMGVNKLAVIKRLRPALAEETAFRNMFLDEARLAARLSHPNIVHTYEVGEQNGVYFIAMEYLEGQSLNKVLKELVRRKDSLEPAHAARIVADALAGLGYAHELRDYDGRPLTIIHRDVSPHNIFLSYDGHTKLVDFGIAKAASSSTETEIGVLKGKVAYMSPEQAMGQKVDARSDLFAMGIVLWELVTQQRLMTGESAANTLHKLMNEPIPRVSSVMPEIDPTLDMLIARALDKNPDNRWQSAAEMREALEAWLATLPHPTRQEEVGRRLVSLFQSVRDEVHRQVQKHMAAITAAGDTSELQALTQESLKRMEQSSAAMTGQLLRLGTAGTGSGSGVIANYGGLGSNPSAYPSLMPPTGFSHPPPPVEEKSNSTLLIVITIGCFCLAALIIVLFRPSSAPKSAEPAFPPPPTTETSDPASPPVITDPAALSSTVPTMTATPTPPPTTTTTSTPSTTRTGRTPSTPTTRTTPTAKPATPPPGPAEEPGFLTVSAYPWAKVSEGGRVICPVTPCNKVQMSPGSHALTFENGESGQKQGVSVVIRSGETSTKNVGFK